jgi:hypothetical protein
MPQTGGKNAKKKSSSSTTKRHFTVVMGGKEHGLYVSSTPSSAAKKAVTKLCAANKSKKVQFEIREITQGSKKKTYGPYSGYIEKLKEPIELKGRVIRYKPVAKLSGKLGAKKGGMFKNPAPAEDPDSVNSNNHQMYAPIAYINWNESEPGKSYANEDDFYEKIEELKAMNDIFDIKTYFMRKNDGTSDVSVEIHFKDFSNIKKNNKNYKTKLETLIELLKYFKKEASSIPNQMNVEFNLIREQDDFTTEYNNFLRDLNREILETTAPNVNKNLRRVPTPKLPNNFPQGSAPPPLNNT